MRFPDTFPSTHHDRIVSNKCPDGQCTFRFTSLEYSDLTGRMTTFGDLHIILRRSPIQHCPHRTMPSA